MRRSKRVVALGMVAALGLIAAACGDDDDSGSATTTAGGGATTTAAATTTAGGATTSAAAPDVGELLSYDESAQCGVDPYTGNMAKIEAVDALTVKFTLCTPDVAFPSKVAFSAFQIMPSEYLESTGGTGDFIDKPIGTGPYKLKTWDRGSQIILEANPDYWGEPPVNDTVVFRWSSEAAQRLVELESGTADGIDNVGTDDFEKIQGNSDLKLMERDATNVFYVGFNRDMAPFDKEEVRQAIGYAVDSQRIVDNFYPKGSAVATQFLPPSIPGYVEGFQGYTRDVAKAKELLAAAGYPDGFDVTLSYRDVVRGYLPQPTVVATDLQAQLAEVGINVTLDLQESGTFIDNANGGKLPFYLLGWGADYPDATNFLDYHFGGGASPQFGAGFDDIHELLAQAASTSDPAARQALYDQANAAIAQHAPMIPIAHGGSATAFRADVTDAHSSPLGNEALFVMTPGDRQQIVWLQNGEPGGLYCADETDGESLRVCEQFAESLLSYKINGTEVEPGLAEAFEPNEDLTEWTFTLRSGVKFHDGSDLDANDVARTYRAQWDAEDPAHVGRVGDFTYFSALFGGFLNPPPAAG